jgi:hypothetical protein
MGEVRKDSWNSKSHHILFGLDVVIYAVVKSNRHTSFGLTVGGVKATRREAGEKRFGSLHRIFEL